MNNYNLIGMTESELLQLLGPPSLDSSVSRKYFNNWDFVYWIGVSLGRAHKCRENIWLVLKSDGHAIVEYRVINKYSINKEFK